MAICFFIGAFIIGFFAVGVVVAGGEEGVIGAVCAQAGAAIARAAAMATPVKSCFMLVFLCGSSDSTLAATACFTQGRPLRALGWKQRLRCFVPGKIRDFRARILPHWRRLI